MELTKDKIFEDSKSQFIKVEDSANTFKKILNNDFIISNPPFYRSNFVDMIGRIINAERSLDFLCGSGSFLSEFVKKQNK